MGRDHKSTNHKRSKHFDKRKAGDDKKSFSHKGKGHFKNQFSKRDSRPVNHPKESSKELESLRECELGITEFVGKTAGFTGIIKSRFSDFHVNEIDLENSVVKLTDQNIPEAPRVEKQHSDEAEKKKKDTIEKGAMSVESWNEVGLLCAGDKDAKKLVEIDVSEKNKEERTLIHNSLKSMYGSEIVSATKKVGDKSFIHVARFNKNDTSQNRWSWPGKYTHFVLYKENMDTMKAALSITSILRCNASAISYAGTKDKRAKTSQWVCMRMWDPRKIYNASRAVPSVKVGNFKVLPDTIKLGQLKGNQFRIALRQINADDATINISLEHIQQNGFINYFGLQRFGNSIEIPTHTIGLAILKGRWQEACELILKPRKNEPVYMQDMRATWWKNRDAGEALAMLHKENKSLEAKLLVGLKRLNKNEYVSALQNIPRNARLLYTHAYQSLIWNKVASRRIQKWGLTLQPGDLVFVDETQDVDEILIDDGIDIDDKEDDDEKSKEKEPVTVDAEQSPFKAMVKPLTQEEIDSGKYSMFDMVLPLPGYDITYPSNETVDWFNELLEADELSSEKLKHKDKSFSLTGSYRKLLAKPQNLSWKVVKYSSPEDNLILSDFEELRGGELATFPDGEHRALILNFVLKPSTYATMALREILKDDTSAAHQQSLEKVTETQTPDSVNAEDEKLTGDGEKRKADDNSSDESTKKIKSN